jgi:predicted permease
MILNSVAPIFAIIALGGVLRRLGMIDKTFINVSDRLIYYIFFPALLFWKIGKPAPLTGVYWELIGATLCAVVVAFALSLVAARLLSMSQFQVGSFSQSCYRFSTYIGMAAVLGATGEEGVRLFGVLIGFAIPFINVLAVSSLIWFSGESFSWRLKSRMLVKAMISNPLILACGCGIAYSSLRVPFPTFVDNTLGLMSLLALPLALVSIGGSLTFEKFREHFAYSATGALVKLVALPAVGYAFLHVFQVTGTAFAVAMIYFGLPTSPQNYILSGQLNSDVDLATSGIVLSTLLSIGSLSYMVVMFHT